jgi:hypothetical protein
VGGDSQRVKVYNFADGVPIPKEDSLKQSRSYYCSRMSFEKNVKWHKQCFQREWDFSCQASSTNNSFLSVVIINTTIIINNLLLPRCVWVVYFLSLSLHFQLISQSISPIAPPHFSPQQ